MEFNVEDYTLDGSGSAMLIDIVCGTLLPRIADLHECARAAGMIDDWYYVHEIESEVTKANNALKNVSPENREYYRKMINEAYAANIDIIQSKIKLREANPENDEFICESCLRGI